MHELILGGQKSGKSRCAEQRAADWLERGQTREAALIATALPGDGEMHERIARHQADRQRRVPRLATYEVPYALPQALREYSSPRRLLVVDCLTLWLTQLRMPMSGPGLGEAAWLARQAALCDALRAAPGPVVLVSNEISFGLAPMGREARRFVDALGVLHQRVAAACERVTLMVAGIEMPVKRP
ncbi:bifunctional adenosylcobinamide kinase/adenosylcobinamide-phosphate guanylyltransferase [Ideonella sp. DXS29W]|uniref:Bifunctional adenosylcobalamin biosynthesis protein n=1 Tax=Ideonella lacteola TaxID=2984193 RepID=A0ABU9BMR7_9BURK